MALGKSILIGAVLLVGATFTASAQSYYPAQYYSPYPVYQRPATPPSWSYDPYTSGHTACVQKRPGDTQPCQDIMQPTYGQPSYWPTR